MRHVPKTGLATQMREWMAAQSGTFSAAEIVAALDIPIGPGRDTLRNALGDFVRRGEIVKAGRTKRKLRQSAYRYAYHHRPDIGLKGGEIQTKVLKAMRLLDFKNYGWAVTDVERLTGLKRSYIDKLTRRLVKTGHLSRDGFRARLAGPGREAVYRIIDTDKFRTELMK